MIMGIMPDNGTMTTIFQEVYSDSSILYVYDAYPMEDFWADYWAVVKRGYRQEKLMDKLRRRLSFTPQLPPPGLRLGKAIFPRARANLPAGLRNRFGKEETAV
jgi:hypothetical protein